MRIIVDGDACPGRQYIEKAAKENNIEVIIFCTYDHMIQSDYSKVILVDSGFQSVDMRVVNETKNKDIIITQDYGVAAMVLSKGAFAISPKGHIYSNENIDKLLFERHLSHKARSAGLKGKNPTKRKKEDDEKLYNNLIYLIKKATL